MGTPFSFPVSHHAKEVEDRCVWALHHIIACGIEPSKIFRAMFICEARRENSTRERLQTNRALGRNWKTKGRPQPLSQARSLLCYWAVRELGMRMSELSRKLKLSQPAVSLSVKRGEKIAKEHQYLLIDDTNL